MIRLKPGVRLKGMQPQLALAAVLAEQVYGAIGADCTITSINDGQHKSDSFHYRGLAMDLRIKDVRFEQRESVITRLADALGPEWDVLWEGKGTENEHAHLEYDPKAVMT